MVPTLVLILLFFFGPTGMGGIVARALAFLLVVFVVGYAEGRRGGGPSFLALPILTLALLGLMAALSPWDLAFVAGLAVASWLVGQGALKTGRLAA